MKAWLDCQPPIIGSVEAPGQYGVSSTSEENGESSSAETPLSGAPSSPAVELVQLARRQGYPPDELIRIIDAVPAGAGRQITAGFRKGGCSNVATDLLLADHLPEVPEPPKGRRPCRRTWIIRVAAFAAFAAELGYLTGNEVQANTRFDQTHQFLDATRQRTAIVVTNLAKVRRELALVNDQVGSA